METKQCKVVAIEHLTLNGVYQAPARADEDTRDGFNFGGWSVEGNDQKMQEVISKYMVDGWSLLAGRLTYEDLYEGWVVRQPTNAMTKALSNVNKYVVSSNANYRPSWQNSILLTGEINDKVAELKKEHDKTLVIFGSGMLVQSLMHNNLIDELVLIFHPLVLPSGRKLFDNITSFSKFKLVETISTETDVVIITYQAN